MKRNIKRSAKSAERVKASQDILAAKRNALLKQTKKSVDIIIKDVYQVARESKEMVRGSTGLIYDKRMVEHRCLWDSNYPECPERFSRVLDRCEELGLVSRCTILSSRVATASEILYKHTEKQIEILQATENCSDEEFLEKLSSNYDAIYIHPSTYQLSLLAAGCTIELIDAICSKKIQNGMAVIRPPGHHAMKSEYCGYCFFNNVALAAVHALNNYDISRILIVDWDVHHGQATQQMFYDDPRVLYFSIHRYEHGSFWPNLRESDFHYIGEGKGKGYNFNVPLNNVGMQDADYLAVFHQILLPVATEFQPNLILVSAGYDAAIGCPEGEMELTPTCYAHLLSSLLCLASGKVAVVLEGGYCLKSLAEGAALTLRCLLGDPCPVLPSLPAPCSSITESILNVIYSHRDYWKCLQLQDTYTLDLLKKSGFGDTGSVLAHQIEKLGCNKIGHVPVIKFLGTDEKPAYYPTRDCYPVQSEEFLQEVDDKLNKLIVGTNLTVPSNRVSVVYDEAMMKHKNIVDPAHPEKPERISSIYLKLEEFGLLERCLTLKARSATDEELSLIHSENHILHMKKLKSLKMGEISKLQDNFSSVYLHPDSYESAAIAAGSVLQVVDSVLNGESRSGVAIVRPPGHHAEGSEPCGFCIFNNVSLAAKYALKVHELKRILLLDWDVHHGNGSQHMFEDNPSVLYISLHRYDNGKFFPSSTDANYTVVGTDAGKGYNINIPWNKRGMGDGDYIAAFHHIVLPVAYQFNPELVLVSAGFDAAVNDPLGGCKVTPEAYGYMTHWLSSLANGKVILCLEGGYNLTSISFAMSQCIKALLGDPLPMLQSKINPCASAITTIRNVTKVQKRYWSCLKFNIFIPSDTVLPDAEEVLKNDRKLDHDIEGGDQVPVENLDNIVVSLLDSLSNLSLREELTVQYSKQLPSQEEVKENCLNDSNYFSGSAEDKSLESPLDFSSNSQISSTGGYSAFCSQLSSPTSADIQEKSEAFDNMVSDVYTLSSTESVSESDAENHNIGDVTILPSSELILNSDNNENVIIATNLEADNNVSSGLGRKVADNEGSSSSSSSNNGAAGGRGGGGSQSGRGNSGPSHGSGSGQQPQRLVDYLAENMHALVAGEMYAVVPLPGCPHLDSVREVPPCGINCSLPCMECGSMNENWICLQCYTVHCGRYINQHMLQHGLEMSHPLTLSFSDISVWCYECEAYIDHQILHSAKNAVHRSKFGSDMSWSYSE